MKKKLLIALSLMFLSIPLAGCKKEPVVTNNYDQGVAYVESRKYTEAIASFEKALGEVPDSAKTYLEIVKIYNIKGLYEKALETLDIGIENSSDDKDLHFLKAQILFDRKDYANAIENFDKAISAGYSTDDVVIRKGESYIKLENFEDAKNEFAKVKSNSEYFADANYYLSLLETEDYVKALEFLNKVKSPKDTNIDSYVSVYNPLLEEIITKSTDKETNPNYLKLLQGYALIKTEQFEIAKTVIQPVANHYVEEGKPSYQANFFLGSIYYHLGNYESAKSELMTSIVANSTDPVTLHLLGLTYSKLNDQVKSLENFEKSVMLDPNNERSRYDYIQALIKFKINSKAETNFEDLIKLETSKKPQYQLEFAQFLNDFQNNPTKANSITSYLINEWGEFDTSSKETQAEIYDAHGWSFYLQNEKDKEAQEFLVKAIEEDEFSGSAYYHLAKVMERTNNFEKAVEYYARAIDLSYDEKLSQSANQEYQRLTQ